MFLFFVFVQSRVETQKCLFLNINVKDIECGPLSYREVYSERKRKKHYVDVVSFVPFLYHIKDGEGSANTSHVKLPLPLTSIKSSGGGSALHFGATENKINQMIG